MNDLGSQIAIKRVMVTRDRKRTVGVKLTKHLKEQIYCITNLTMIWKKSENYVFDNNSLLLKMKLMHLENKKINNLTSKSHFKGWLKKRKNRDRDNRKYLFFYVLLFYGKTWWWNFKKILCNTEKSRNIPMVKFSKNIGVFKVNEKLVSGNWCALRHVSTKPKLGQWRILIYSTYLS